MKEKAKNTCLLAGRKKTRLIIVFVASPKWLKQFFLPIQANKQDFYALFFHRPIGKQIDKILCNLIAQLVIDYI